MTWKNLTSHGFKNRKRFALGRSDWLINVLQKIAREHTCQSIRHHSEEKKTQSACSGELESQRAPQADLVELVAISLMRAGFFTSELWDNTWGSDERKNGRKKERKKEKLLIIPQIACQISWDKSKLKPTEKNPDQTCRPRSVALWQIL